MPMFEASEQYVRIYASRQVSRPDPLFAKVVDSLVKVAVVGVERQAPDPTLGNGPGADSGQPADDFRPFSDRQKVAIFEQQRRMGLSDGAIRDLCPEIYSGSVASDPFRVDLLSMSQAYRLVGWLQDCDQSPEPGCPGPSEPLRCCCEELRAAASAQSNPDANAVQMREKALEARGAELPVTTLDTWLKETERLRCDGEDLVVRVPSVFTVAGPGGLGL